MVKEKEKDFWHLVMKRTENTNVRGWLPFFIVIRGGVEGYGEGTVQKSVWWF